MSFEKAFSTARPVSVEGMASSKMSHSNSNILNENNTGNLQFTVDKILPEHSISAISAQQKIQENFSHRHPSYLNVACLPFAQYYYSLDSYDEFRGKNVRPAGKSTDTDSEEEQFESVFSK